MNTVIIGDNAITLQDFINVAKFKYQVKLSDTAVSRIEESRSTIESIINSGKIVYGINTGFGSLSNKSISPNDLDLLQKNLIESHAIGCGDAAPEHIVRGMFLLRLTCISNGNSGVCSCVAHSIVECLNKNFIPMVPVQGTVGASGDLAPLSHLFLALMGKGKAFSTKENAFIDSSIVLSELAIKPITLKAKEGLALNNGTQFITSNTAFALDSAWAAFNAANIIAATTLEALHGTHVAFDKRIHDAKNHSGQVFVADTMRRYLCPDGTPSEINLTHVKKVQDAYSLRCIAQVHGPVYDMLKFVQKTVEIEMNSSNDNPLIFGSDVISGGNFHGAPIAKAADYIAIVMADLCNISERRIDRMMNPALNGFLPSFLVKDAGLNSGLMIVQYAAAGITAENRQLANPSSVHNIPTCQGTEDIVSMGGHSSRKAVISVDNTFKVLAYELLTAFQAMSFTKEKPYYHIKSIIDYIATEISPINSDTYIKNHYDFILHFILHDIHKYI